MKDYLSILSEIPAKHSGLLFEQINRAIMMSSAILRTHGLTLPGKDRVPRSSEIRDHLCQMMNRAIDGYYGTKDQAPATAKANEIWGEDGDKLFSVVVTGISENLEDGFTAEIDMNLLYAGEN